jgi:uncharacterized protein (TIGR02598 family)
MTMKRLSPNALGGPFENIDDTPREGTRPTTSFDFDCPRRALFQRAARTGAAFSLIEVVLALSIVALGMLTILGLFPQGLTSAKNAADDSLCAMVAQDTIADRKIQIETGTNNAAIGVVGTNPNRWFDAKGKELFTTSPTNAMFNCLITATPNPSYPNLEITQVQIMWPWYNASTTTKTPAPPNTNTFVTEIVKY